MGKMKIYSVNILTPDGKTYWRQIPANTWEEVLKAIEAHYTFPEGTKVEHLAL